MGLRKTPDRSSPPPPCTGGGAEGLHGFHIMEREVRPHPVLPGRLQDRLVCVPGPVGCRFVMYDWGRAFSPNPKVGPNGHDGIPA